MALTLTTLESDIRDEIGEISAGRWSQAQIVRAINRTTESLISTFVTNNCWQILMHLTKEISYKLDGSRSYSLYTVIGNSTDFYTIVNAYLGDANRADTRIIKVGIDEFHRICDNPEYNVDVGNPYYTLWKYDSTTGHGNLPYIWIYPYSVTRYLWLRFLRNYTPIVITTNETCDMPDICRNTIVYGAAKRLWIADRNPDMATIMAGDYTRELRDLIENYNEGWQDDLDIQRVT